MKKKRHLLLLMFLTTSFSAFAQTKDNAEIRKMYEEDQSARKVQNIDWVLLNKNDSVRAKRVYELLDSGKIITGKDYYHSAMIFQHGRDTTASGMAVKLMKKSIALDSTVNRWLLAAAIDRDLMRKGLPQIYGTQFVKMGQNAKFERYRIDSTQITDTQRKYYFVETLAEQKIKERKMNLMSVMQFYSQEKSLDKTLELIIAEKDKGNTASYDVSEEAINSFAYRFINTPQDALKIFKLNTELYPDGFNTFDSYGECLLLLNKKEEAKVAYKRSLQLNPRNNNALEKLKEL
jgi:tetratricopeptide (TPR) repeat protein